MSTRSAAPYILGGAGIAAFCVALNHTLRGGLLPSPPGMPARDPFKGPRPGELPSSIPSHTVVVDAVPPGAITVEQASPKPGKPAPATAQTRTPREAAQQLYAYVTPIIRAGHGAAELGSAAAPNHFIANAQRDMRLIASDGVYGPKTMARGKELLGREFPARAPTKTRVTAPAAATKPKPKPTKPAASPKPLTPPGGDGPPVEPPQGPLPQLWPGAGTVLEQMPPAPAPPPPSQSVKRSPRDAAVALYALVTTEPVDWGTAAAPNELIRQAQRDMGGAGVAADGVYGPKTAARGAALLGKAFPQRAARSAQAAASELYALVTATKVDWGTKAKPNKTIAAAQRDLGVAADGVYGPKTAARAAEVLGKAFPARG